MTRFEIAALVILALAGCGGISLVRFGAHPPTPAAAPLPEAAAATPPHAYMPAVCSPFDCQEVVQCRSDATITCPPANCQHTSSGEVRCRGCQVNFIGQ